MSLSTEYEEKRNGASAVAVWTVDIVFPEFDVLPAKSFHWSTSRIEQEIDDISYENLLSDFPTGSHSRDRGNDFAQFSAVNPNNSLYVEFYPYQEIIERGEVTIKECYELDGGFFESEVRFFGYLKEFTNNQSSLTLDFTAMSDMSRTGNLVANFQLTRERCKHIFNINGLRSAGAPDFDPCGWQVAQGGNPLFCSKYLEGVDGCKAHNNAHRIGMVKGLSNAEIEVLNAHNSSGFDYGSSSPCFIGGTKVLMSDYSLKSIELVKDTDKVIGFDIFTDRLIETRVLNLRHHAVGEFENAEFIRAGKKRNFGVTKNHLFYLGNARFQALGALQSKIVQGITKLRKRCEILCNTLRTVFGNVIVYNIQTECGTYLIASDDMEIILKVHNWKLEL